jgi:hypothetical protein
MASPYRNEDGNAGVGEDGEQFVEMGGEQEDAGRAGDGAGGQLAVDRFGYGGLPGEGAGVAASRWGLCIVRPGAQARSSRRVGSQRPIEGRDQLGTAESNTRSIACAETSLAQPKVTQDPSPVQRVL